MENRYGVDITYFEKELDALKASLPNRTPEELQRYFLRLANIARVTELHGCDCQHDMEEEISILKAENQRMRDAIFAACDKCNVQQYNYIVRKILLESIGMSIEEFKEMRNQEILKGID